MKLNESSKCDKAFYLRKKERILLCSKSKDSGVFPGWFRTLFVILFPLLINN